MIYDAASEGTHVILGMLIVGLVFLTVIILGELTHWVGHRRAERRRSHPSAYLADRLDELVPDPFELARVRLELRTGRATSGEHLANQHQPARMQEQVVDATIENDCVLIGHAASSQAGSASGACSTTS